LMNKDMRTIFQKGDNDLQAGLPYAQSGAFLAGGGTFGLRYRFGYR
jgi:hypothetical protein